MEVLLQKMFEKELEIDELGPNITNIDQDLDDRGYLASENQTLWSM